jgi:hypothetical protein
MTATLKRLAGEPILIVTYDGFVDIDTVVYSYTESAKLIADSEERVYRISDFSKASSNFAEVIRIVNSSASGPGSINDPRIVPMYVGTDSMVRLAADFFKQKGKIIALFKNMDDAIDSARLQAEQLHAQTLI